MTTKLLSVVIPTLGGSTLQKTINSLNNGTIVPNEILLCIPNELAYKVLDLKYNNIRVIKTNKYGQVLQRFEGFKEAKNELVLQLDDDIILDKNCIELMVKTLDNIEIECAVCPVYYIDNIDPQNLLIKNKFYQSLINPKSNFRLLLNKIVHGKQKFNDGEITSSSINIHFNPINKDKQFYELCWLPGGCVLHKKSNLYLENFYKFRGKAYCEDLIHSFYLKQNGVKLFVSKNSFAVIHFYNETSKLNYFKKLNYIYSEFRARLFYTNISNSSYLHLILFYFTLYFHLPFTFLIKILKFNATRK